MTASYTWDVFTTLDGYGSYEGEPDWGGYWSKQGPELLEHRAALYATQQRMVLGATTFREMAQIWSSDIDPNLLDVWNQRLRPMPMTVVSSTLHDTLGWPDATIASGDAVEIISALKRESDLPLRSPGGSITLNRALLAAGLGRPPRGDSVPSHQRRQRHQPDPALYGQLRPRAARQQDA